MDSKQDLPPKEGFGNINYKPTPAKKFFSSKVIAAGLLAFCVVEGFRNRQKKLIIKTQKLEENDFEIAMTPFLSAERDRNFLKVLNKNREIELKIMKDVPGWEPGTFYGKPFYKTVPKGELITEIVPTFMLTHPLDKQYKPAEALGLC